MKILLTGATGQLASDLSAALKDANLSVKGYDSKSLDVSDGRRVMEEVSAIRPGIIINCGAYTKVDLAEKEREQAFAVNKDGPANLAEAAQKVNAVLVHISTDFVFDGLKSTPYAESDRTNPLSVYGESKLAGETEIMERMKNYIIVRTSWLYGKNGHNFVKTILKYAAERDFLNVVYDQVGTPTWTVDLTDALLKIVESVQKGSKEYGIYNFSNEGVASWYDFADAIVEEAKALGAVLQCEAVRPILTSEYPTLAKRPAYSVLDKSKIKNTFNLTIPHWRASLKKMLRQIGPGKEGGIA
jgi:dTDP-4-dehydrorhamnose reductase